MHAFRNSTCRSNVLPRVSLGMYVTVCNYEYTYAYKVREKRAVYIAVLRVNAAASIPSSCICRRHPYFCFMSVANARDPLTYSGKVRYMLYVDNLYAHLYSTYHRTTIRACYNITRTHKRVVCITHRDTIPFMSLLCVCWCLYRYIYFNPGRFLLFPYQVARIFE